MKKEEYLGGDNREVMVSVCCPTYNHEKYLEETLKGFVMQVTNFRFEVIVHEDASTDNTREILKRYADLYPDIIVPIYQDENQYSKARGLTFRNMLLKSTGKYIAVCEGDDFWTDEHKLQKQYDIMETNPECSICVHNITRVYEDGSKEANNIDGLSFQQGVIEKEQIAEILWKDGACPFHTSSFFIRRHVLQPRIDYKEPFLKCMNGDMIMYKLSLMQGKFYYIDEIMSCRRKGVAGSWNARWLKKSAAEKVAFYKDFADGDVLFDKYSNYAFHDYIKYYIFSLMSECCIYDTKDVKEYMKNYSLSPDMIRDKRTLWMYIRYLILKTSPKLYKFLCGVQRKMNKGS